MLVTCFRCLLPDIDDLPLSVKNELFEELLDKDVQKGEKSDTTNNRLGLPFFFNRAPTHIYEKYLSSTTIL